MDQVNISHLNTMEPTTETNNNSNNMTGRKYKFKKKIHNYF